MLTALARVSRRPAGLQCALVARLRDCLLDCDVMVDDRRAELELVIKNVRQAVEERDRVARQLQAAIVATDEPA